MERRTGKQNAEEVNSPIETQNDLVNEVNVRLLENLGFMGGSALERLENCAGETDTTLDDEVKGTEGDGEKRGDFCGLVRKI